MTNIRVLPGIDPEKKIDAQPNEAVIHLLEMALEQARAGQLPAIAMALVIKDGGKVWSVYECAKGYGHRLVSAIRCVQRDFESDFFDGIMEDDDEELPEGA